MNASQELTTSGSTESKSAEHETKEASRPSENDPSRASQLLPLVYEELQVLAKQKLFFERSDQTLQATDLVHEAYVRLAKSKRSKPWQGRAHFFVAAAESMWRIMIDQGRRRNALKRGGNAKRFSITVTN